MSTPLFSIVLPTKGRGFLVGKAVRSVLQQTVTDLEMILVDNDDSDATREVAAEFTDRRFRYVRTGGLSMRDNWERGALEARGEFMLLIEDKQMLKSTALAQILEEAERCKAECVRWMSDSFDDEFTPARIRRAKGSGEAIVRTSDELLESFVRDVHIGYKQALPLPQLAAMRRSLIERIRGGPMQRLYHEASPDICLGVIQLAYTDFVLDLKRSLVVYTSSVHSNGRAGQRKQASVQDFLRRLSGGEEMCYNLVPIRSLCVPSCAFNDYLRIQQKLQGRLARHPLSWTKYFVQSHESMMGARDLGVDMTSDLDLWEQALALQPDRVKQEVSTHLLARSPKSVQGLGRALKGLAKTLHLPSIQRHCKRWFRGYLKGDPEWRFSSPEDYVNWDKEQQSKTARQI